MSCLGKTNNMLDFFLSSLFWASIVVACFFGILIIADWVITSREINKLVKRTEQIERESIERNQDEN